MSNLIGLKNVAVRPAGILTNTYVTGTTLTDCEKFNGIYFNYDFTLGSLTDAQIKIEVSMDGTNYYQLVSDSIAAGIDTITNLVYKLTGTSKGSTTPIQIATKYIKISAIGTGTTTGSSLKIDAVLIKV